MIIIDHVSKFYGRFRALDNISCTIQPGEIVGLLGRNGAGKTTLMRILTGYLPASSGRVLVRGVDIEKSPLIARRCIGYLPETPPLYPSMTVGEYLSFAARLKDVPARELKSKLQRVLSECGLKEAQGKVIARLSLGYKQRIGIAQAIINEPPILILDEPTKGLDPVQVRQVRSLIVSLKERCTVILSTHVLSEIHQMAQRVVVIEGGRIIADSPLKELLAAYGHDLEKAFFALTNTEVPA
jgi:ABC-2 type transport system ATP-binding protein